MPKKLENVTGNCFKDGKVTLENATGEYNARNRPCIKGTCPKCGKKVVRLISNDEASKHGMTPPTGTAPKKTPVKGSGGPKKRPRQTRSRK